VLEADEQEGVYTESIDMGKVEEIRRRIPVFQDRRTEFYNIK